jgi:peroxiredoxin
MVIRTSLFVALRLFGRGVCVLFAGLVLFGSSVLAAQTKQLVWTAEEKPIADQISGLRSLPDDFRGKMTQQLAIQIRRLPATENKLRLAYGLANLATEGDPGGETTLQDVATTLADTLAEVKPSASGGRPSAAYVELARLVRYEHVEAKSEDPQFGAAMAELEADDARLRQPDFTLTDLDGKSWTLSELRGKVVLVNFWATWCPPCRKEMPDLEALHGRFSANDLVILGISDEKAETVKAFLAQKNYTYTIALDPGRKVSEQFGVEGIPKTFVFDRDGNLVAQSMDMRTGKQFLEMLASAGLK